MALRQSIRIYERRASAVPTPVNGFLIMLKAHLNARSSRMRIYEGAKHSVIETSRLSLTTARHQRTRCKAGDRG